MTAYVLRRLLLMIPTFFGILIINFGVLRLQSDSLVEVSQESGSGKSSDGVGGERKAGGASRQYENHIDRLRRVGNDLPALVNTRGFLSKEDVVADLRSAAPTSGHADSKRNRIEKSLWLLGRFGVAPLAEVLRDDALAVLHGPASQAFALCAYTTIDPRDAERMSPAELGRIHERNRVLREHVIAFVPDAAAGYRCTDAGLQSKRQVLLAVYDDPVNAALYRPTSGARWSAVLADTGFTTFMQRLFTGNLWSETRKRYVFDVIGERWSVTVWLNLLSVGIAWTLSIPIGIRSARRIGTTEDRLTTNALFMLWSLPSFFVGALLLHHFCTDQITDGRLVSGWFPNAGLSSPGSLWFSTPGYLLDLLWHGFLPLLVLTYASFTSLSRNMRGNLLDQLGSDYARTARAKGCSEDAVIYRHCLRNSLLTMITLGSGLLAELFAGVLVVEMLFSIPGLGWLLLEAAKQNDAPLIMGATVIQVGLLLFGILVADVLYALVDPRIRNRYG